MTNLKEFYEHVATDPEIKIFPTNVVVTDDVTAVEVQLWVNGFEYYSAKGTSRRDPGDPINPEIAIKLALGRAVRQLGRDILREGQDGVRDQDKIVKSQKQASDRAKANKEARRRQIETSYTYATY